MLSPAPKEKIKGLQGELVCKQDLTMQEESETFEVFSDLYDTRLDALYKLELTTKKLPKLRVSKARTDEAKVI